MISIFDNKYPASLGVDGDINTFFHTRKGDVAWWAVDLGAEKAHVTRVRIVNRIITAGWGQLTLSCHHNYHTHTRMHARTHKCFSTLGENTGEHVFIAEQQKKREKFNVRFCRDTTFINTV